MDRVSGRLLVFFEAPYWVGVFEVVTEGRLSVCKVTFGAEPKDYEILEFILRNHHRLRFSPSIPSVAETKGHRNPKRLQREVKKQVANAGIGTKSQQALNLQLEQKKIQRKIRSREQKEEEKQLRFQMKQQKRKERHRGR